MLRGELRPPTPTLCDHEGWVSSCRHIPPHFWGDAMPRTRTTICPDCRAIHRTMVPGALCRTCRTHRARARPAPVARGYDTAHRRMRARYTAMQRQGVTLTCARCGLPIPPDVPFDLGHTDDRTTWTGPEHPTCNRSAAGRAGAMVTNQRDE